MPKAQGQKYHYLDHDTDFLDPAPPVQNQWYTIMDASDVRLVFCTIKQYNNDVAVKNIEVRWTIDGNVYFRAYTANNAILYWIFRYFYPSFAGTDGLLHNTNECNAAFYTCKRGQHFKVEVRMTSAPGTNQHMECFCLRETLELT